MSDELPRLSDDDLVRVFATEIERQNELITTDPPDPVRGNEAADTALLAYRLLKGRGPASQRKILGLMQDPRRRVRVAAAAYALEFEPDAARNVLQSLLEGPGPDPSGARFIARIVLREWNAGRTKFPAPA